MIKALGLDLGTKTLGIAHSDSLGFVHGLETFRFPRMQFNLAINRVMEILEEKDIDHIALGLPLHFNGEMSEMANNVMLFKEELLKKNPNLVIELIDERLTSVQANNTLTMLDVSHQKRKDTVDTLAAIEILETYVRKVG